MTDFMNEYCMHTATCGELRRGDVGREVVLTRLGVAQPRPRRPHLHRPARPRGLHAGGRRPRLRERRRLREGRAPGPRVRAEDRGHGARARRGGRQPEHGHGRDRGAGEVRRGSANTSVTPPFSIEDGIETDETTRMKWRYLDIRRPEMYQALHLRHTVAQAMRGALNERGFLEVETPILANSTPEGARDYIVPSRPNPGRFYRAAAEPAAVQADAHGGRHRALLPDRPLLPRRGPARRPPARVHAGGHRDGLRAGRGRDEPHGGRHGRDAGRRGRGACVPACSACSTASPWTASATTVPTRASAWSSWTSPTS